MDFHRYLNLPAKAQEIIMSRAPRTANRPMGPA
jgi:hypothetical protein